jgi:hypothetical protein
MSFLNHTPHLRLGILSPRYCPGLHISNSKNLKNLYHKLMTDCYWRFLFPSDRPKTAPALRTLLPEHSGKRDGGPHATHIHYNAFGKQPSSLFCCLFDLVRLPLLSVRTRMRLRTILAWFQYDYPRRPRSTRRRSRIPRQRTTIRAR